MAKYMGKSYRCIQRKKNTYQESKKCFKITANSTWEAGKGARKQREKQEKTRMKTESEINKRSKTVKNINKTKF